MSTLEDRLRDAFRADADLVRPDSIPAAPPRRAARNAPRRPRSRRTRALIPLAAAAAVVAIVAGLSLAATQHGGSRPAAGSSSPPPGPTPTPSAPAGPLPKPTLAANASQGVPASAPAAGVPRFYAAVYLPAGVRNYIVVRDTATGQVTGRIDAPRGAVFAGLAATAGDRTFITTIQAGSGCSVQLYQFQLNQRGAPGPMEPLHIALPSAPEGEGDLAITPDGRTIAYESGVCNTAPYENEVGVINLATGQARVWAVPLALVNSALVWPNMDVSLSANGGLLGYAMTLHGAGVLPTSAPAGSLFARSRPVSGPVIWAAIAGDGRSLYGCSVSHGRGQPTTYVGALSYSRISLTGGGNQVIASWPDVTGPQCFASLDPAGNYLLVQFPTVAHGVDGSSRPAVVNVNLRNGLPVNIWSRAVILNLRTGQLTNINAPAYFGPFDIAW
jgi:hypothetical protein